MHAERRYLYLLDELSAEFPGFRMIRKDQSVLQRSIAVALAAVTLGGQGRYLEDYVTTIGRRIYVPATWLDGDAGERCLTLLHERVHLRQFRRYGLPLMAFLYLLVPVPLGLAWFRMRFEREAYEVSIRATAALQGRAAVEDPAFRRHIESQFTSAAYGWMWPFPRAIARWYGRVLDELPDELPREEK